MQGKLPVLPILIAGISLCLAYRVYAFKIMAPWFLILTLGPSILVLSSGEETLEAVDENGIWEGLFFILRTIGWGSIAVLWHWRILRDDSLSGKVMIFDKRVWLYILRFMVISIIIGVTCFLLVAALTLPASNFLILVFGSTAFFGMLVGAVLSAILVGARLSVALPALALNVPKFGLSDAWQVTAGNGVRLLIVTLLPFLPLILLTVDIELNGRTLLDPSLWSAPFVVKHFANLSLEFVFGLLSLTVLSLTYAFFADTHSMKDKRQAAS